MKKIKVNKSIRPILKKMELNQTECFPIQKAGNVRATCTSLSISDKLRFSTRQINEKNVIEVERIK